MNSLDFLLLLILFVGLGGSFAYWHRRRLFIYRNEVKNLSHANIIAEVENERLGIYRKMIMNSPNVFLVVDQSLQVVTSNRAAEKYEWFHSRAFEVSNISDNCKLHFSIVLNKVLKQGLPVHGEMKLTKNSEDDWNFILYSIYPVHDTSGQIIAASLSAVDATEQRKAELHLQKQSEFIEGVLNAIPDPIYVQNADGKWIYGNKAFSHIVNQDWPSYQSKSYEDVFPFEVAQLVRSYDSEAFKSFKTIEIEESYKLKDGRHVTFLSKRTSITPLKGEKIVLAILRDISERKKLESDLQISKARQYEAARLATLGETAGGIAHEINNPLNVIVGLAELMKITVEKKGAIDPEKLNDYCDRLVEYSMRIAKIIKGLRSISRDASQDPFAEVDLKLIVEEATEFSQQQLTNRGIELILDLPEKSPLISGRYAQISQIVMNLFNNARDAVESRENAKIYVRVFQEDDFAVIRVWDSGLGVPKEIEEKLMTPFFTTKPAGKGTGLGLSISRSIAKDHNGVLYLNRSVADSCFELRLPLMNSTTNSEAA
jgi:PAS domain S-box-containing protein